MSRSIQAPSARHYALTAILAMAALAVTLPSWLAATDDPVPFTDIEAQSVEFIALEQSIELTSEQEAIKKAALTALPAPCCSNNTAYTCCCPCNMSRSIWGLSNLLITKHGYDAEQVRGKVEEWITRINPDGFSGDTCYTGGCGRPFEKNGCGGMNPRHVIW